jgi:hypothetical protein
MNPLEAMARAMHADEWSNPENPSELWDCESADSKAYWLRQARAARDALADSIDARYVCFDFSTSATELDEMRFRAAIRAAGEEG